MGVFRACFYTSVHYEYLRGKVGSKTFICGPGQVTQVVGASFHTPKGCSSVPRGWQTFSKISYIIIIFSFSGHTDTVEATQLCCCNAKAAIYNRQTDRHGCVPMKLYLQKQMVGCSLLTPTRPAGGH